MKILIGGDSWGCGEWVLEAAVNGNNNYYTSNNALTPPEVKYYTKTKFEKR